MCDMLIQRAWPETIANVTAFGTTVVHQLAARGHLKTLERVLPRMASKLGKERLVALMDLKVGRLELGSVDTALRANIDIAKLLKAFELLSKWSPRKIGRAGEEGQLQAHTMSVRTAIRRWGSRWEKQEGYAHYHGGYSSSSGGYKR